MQHNPLPPIDPRLVERAQEQIASRHLVALREAVAEHAEWTRERLPRPRHHDIVLHGRARRIGEDLDFGGGI